MKRLLILLLIATGLFAQSESGGYYIPSKWKLSGTTISPANSWNMNLGGATGLFWDETNKRLGIGTTIPASALEVIGNISVGAGAKARNLAGNVSVGGTRTILNWHGFEDESILSPASGDPHGYASYDAQPTVSGSLIDITHLVGFQSRAIFNDDRNLTSYWDSFNAAPTHNGTGTISLVRGLYVQDIAGVGAVTNNYGIYLENIARGSTNNYAIYSAGGKSFHSGNLGLGAAATNPDAALNISTGSGVSAAIAVYRPSSAQQSYIGFKTAGSTSGSNVFWSFGLSSNSGNFGIKTYDGSTSSERLSITTSGNLGIATTNPLATFHDNGTAMFGAGTGASLTDSSFVINYTSGSPVANWYGTDGDTWNIGINTSDGATFNGATTYNFDNDLLFPEAGSSINSKAIKLQADNAATTQEGSIQVMYGADPYLRLSAPNDAGTATAILDLKDQRVVIGAGTDGVDYDIFWNGFSNQGSITYMEDEDRIDVDNDFKIGASLWGSAVMSGTDAFTTTATADTVTVSGATVNDIYMLTYTTAVTAAEAPLSVTATATGFIATRPAGTTSGAGYAWTRQRK